MEQFKGEISDFPIEVVEKMLDYQEQTYGKKDISVFEEYSGAGFHWYNTDEGWEFWHQIIRKKNFDLFFQKYPRKLIFEENTAYQAETKEEAEMLLAEAHRQGYKWCNQEPYISNINWSDSNTCYNITEGVRSFLDWYIDQGRKVVTVKEFFNLTNKTMNNRFPFGLYTSDAQRIIDIACGNWKVTLADKWSKEIVLKKLIQVDEEFYKEMRKACTKEQNLLFDEIFGVDIVEIDFSILNDEDVFYLRTGCGFSYLFVGKDPIYTKVQAFTLTAFNKERIEKITDKLCSKVQVVELRKATKEEQELYYKHYPQWSLKDAKDGEPVWISETGGVWMLRYADGQDAVYCDQRKKGMTMSKEGFKFIKKFDPNNLPVNN